MEDLTKQQLILLALLVSFVTSLATGIVTVSLVNQAPPVLTETINRVVEKTIERVVTEPAKQAAAVVMKETVVVRSDDLVIAAIDKNAKSVVRIRGVSGDGENQVSRLAGLGLIISESGIIAADISVAYRPTDANGDPVPEVYGGVFSDGRTLPLTILANDQATGVLFLQPVPDTKGAAKSSAPFPQPVFSAQALKLGQAVVALGGVESNAVSTGIVSRLLIPARLERGVATSTTTGERELIGIETDMRATELLSGSVLLNLSGEVVGMSVGTTEQARNVFLPIAKILIAVPKSSAPLPVGL